jgi:hypothetical protein
MADHRQEKTMRRIDFRYAFTTTLGAFLLLGSTTISTAQVKQVQMHIGGYLCGN